MILRIDDTDTGRNTQESMDSIFQGLRWLDLVWDEQYRQSERLNRHQILAEAIFDKGLAYRDFTPAQADGEGKSHAGSWLCNAGMRELSREESDRRASSGEPYVLRFRVPRDRDLTVRFQDHVYGEQCKSTAEIEDFALLRSNGMPTYHMASCADDIELRISHIIRGQDHLTNTFKHVLIFDAVDAATPEFAHLPLLIAPDGSKLSKRKHGPVVSVATYRDAGFLPHAYVNFLCLLGWSPKDNREQMSRPELVEAFSFAGINRSNAVVNFSDSDPIDTKALWLNSQHLRTMPVAELAPFVRLMLEQAGISIPYGEAWFLHTLDIIRSRFSTLLDFATRGRPYFCENYPIEPEALEQLNQPGARELVRELAGRIADSEDFTEAAIERQLRKLAAEKGVKAGLIMNGSRAALTGQTVGPGAFAVFLGVGRERAISRLSKV